MKKKTDTRRVGASKSNRKEIKSVTTPCPLRQKRKGNSKINDQIKKYLYNWIMRNPQVLQSPIFNDGLKLYIDSNTEPQLVPKLLLQVSVQELHNIVVSDTENGGLKDTRDAEDNIIISDYKLHSLLPPQLKKCH